MKSRQKSVAHKALPSIFLLILLTLAFFTLRINTEKNKYKRLAEMPNQACIGLSEASNKGIIVALPELHSSQLLYNNDPYGRTANFVCKIGINTKAATKGLDVAQIDSDGYEMGAEVTYFKTQAEAEKYADQKINPMRYWGVVNPVGNISQTSPFTSKILGKPIYFDSYTVKGKALVRISLPCSSANKTIRLLVPYPSAPPRKKDPM